MLKCVHASRVTSVFNHNPPKTDGITAKYLENECLHTKCEFGETSFWRSMVNHYPYTTDISPPNIYKMNVFGQIASFGKRALGGLWLSACIPAVLKSVHVSCVKARV